MVGKRSESQKAYKVVKLSNLNNVVMGIFIELSQFSLNARA